MFIYLCRHRQVTQLYIFFIFLQLILFFLLMDCKMLVFYLFALTISCIHGRIVNFEEEGGLSDGMTDEIAWKNGNLMNVTLNSLQPGMFTNCVILQNCVKFQSCYTQNNSFTSRWHIFHPQQNIYGDGRNSSLELEFCSVSARYVGHDIK